MQSATTEKALQALIASHLVPARQDDPLSATVRSRLLDRVHQSAQAHKGYLTIRREDGNLPHSGSELRSRLLRSDEKHRVAIVQLHAGAPLPWPADATAQEIMVLEGALASAPADVNDGLLLAPVVTQQYAYHVRHLSKPGLALHAVGETTLYVRSLLVTEEHLSALEVNWWQLANPSSGWVDPARRRWLASSAGVEVLPLRSDNEVASMLVRFMPGASVPDHFHSIHEDCLVLEGEMFLGDILLRTGDYQLAPAGTSHFGENSDVGVLFYFHGALDPVLKG